MIIFERNTLLVVTDEIIESRGIAKVLRVHVASTRLHRLIILHALRENQSGTHGLNIVDSGLHISDFWIESIVLADTLYQVGVITANNLHGLDCVTFIECTFTFITLDFLRVRANLHLIERCACGESKLRNHSQIMAFRHVCLCNTSSQEGFLLYFNNTCGERDGRKISTILEQLKANSFDVIACFQFCSLNCTALECCIANFAQRCGEIDFL